MDTNQETLSLREGMDVIGSDGEKLGSVDRLEGEYVVAKKGWLFPTDYYLPESAVSSVDEDRVVLNVTKDEVLNQGWDIAPGDRNGTDTFISDSDTRDVAPSYGDGTATGMTGGITNAGAAPLTGDGGFADSTSPGNRADLPFEHRADHEDAHTDNSDAIRVPLSEEELTATRRSVDRGEVRVEKEVETEQRELDVPVTEERVNVTRRVVDRDVDSGDMAFENDTIEVPVRGEEVDVQKRARVTEEIELSKEAVEENQHVSDTVRRERARVTDTTSRSDDEDLKDTSR